MNQFQYRLIGWGILILGIAVSLNWCFNETGLTGMFLQLSNRLFEVRLKQGSCLITFLILILPAYGIKRYFDERAWDAYVKTLPPPDIRESVKRSRYVTPDVSAPPPPPKPVEISSIPENQAEFVATCAACGNLFSARKDTKSLKCPNCGENIPLSN